MMQELWRSIGILWRTGTAGRVLLGWAVVTVAFMFVLAARSCGS